MDELMRLFWFAGRASQEDIDRASGEIKRRKSTKKEINSDDVRENFMKLKSMLGGLK